MNDFLLIIGIIAPFFTIATIGYWSYGRGYFSNNHLDSLIKFTNDICVPVIFIRLLSKASLPDSSTLSIIITYNLIILIVFAIVYNIAKKHTEPTQAVLIGFAAIFSNTFMLGVPLAIYVFGEQQAIPYLVLVSIDILVVFSLIILLLESKQIQSVYSLRKKSFLLGYRIFKHPIIAGIIIGLVMNALSYQLPPLLDYIAIQIQSINVPLAIVCLGACIARLGIRGNILLACSISFSKIILVPALTLLAIVLLGDVPIIWAKSLMLMAALPVGVSVFVFASRYNIAKEFAASVIFISSVISPISLFFLLYLFEKWEIIS